TLGRGATLLGTLYGRDGKPVAEEEVTLEPADRAEHAIESGDWRPWVEYGVWGFFCAKCRTDRYGRYAFRGLPLPRDGKPQPRAVKWHGASSETAAAESDNETFIRDLRLDARARPEHPDPKPPVAPEYRVTGRVLDESGRPVA